MPSKMTYAPYGGESIRGDPYKAMAEHLRKKTTMAEMNYTVGARVTHTIFGKGTITGVTLGTVVITFDNHGMKELQRSFIVGKVQPLKE